jgi:hypothetical protein
LGYSKSIGWKAWLKMILLYDIKKARDVASPAFLHTKLQSEWANHFDIVFGIFTTVNVTIILSFEFSSAG